MFELLIEVDHPREDTASVQFGLASARQPQAFAAGLHVVPRTPSMTALRRCTVISKAEEH